MEKISYLIEEDRVYLSSKLNERKFSKLLGISSYEVKYLLYSQFNMSFKAFIAVNRVLYARSIMVSRNIDYKNLWFLSGFRSFREFSKICSRVGF